MSNMTDNILDQAIDFSLTKIGKQFSLKPEQREIIRTVVEEKKDVLGILPTGFGKSVVFHILSYVLDYMKFKGPSEQHEAITIVISPLNALMQDQISKLSNLGAVILDGSKENIELTLSLASEGKLQLVFAHPEILLEDKRVKKKVLKSLAFQRNVKALVVDETHLVDEWKEFRPAFTKLDVLCSIFPNVPVIALTATATISMKHKIIESIGLDHPVVVQVVPDRPNIYFESRRRPNKKDERNEILLPFVEELIEKRSEMALTIFYGNLETCADSFIYFSSKMGEAQYEPIHSEQISKNRLFTQYHAQYPKYELERIMGDFLSGNCKHRVFFVTVAFGIGIDCSSVRSVIHLGVPHTMEEYFQEAGRAGRDGLPAEAILYYNSYDVSKGKKGLQDTMIRFATSSTSQCKREIIMNHFGFSLPLRNDEDHNCCDYHKSICKCNECLENKALIEAVDKMSFNTTNVKSTEEEVPTCKSITEMQRNLLYERLHAYRESLGDSRSCVGSVTFSTGFSVELIEMVVESCDRLDSINTVMRTLPVFSEENAKVIFDIVKDVLQLN